MLLMCEDWASVMVRSAVAVGHEHGSGETMVPGWPVCAQRTHSSLVPLQ